MEAARTLEGAGERVGEVDADASRRHESAHQDGKEQPKLDGREEEQSLLVGG